MPDPLDLEPIKALCERAIEEDWGMCAAYVVPEMRALIAEVERLRNERGFWKESTHHLSKVRSEDVQPGG